MTAIPTEEAALLRLAANLLYPAGDPRAMPWPDPVALGLIRSRLRGLADVERLDPAKTFELGDGTGG